MHELRGTFKIIVYEVIFYLCFILDLMKEWSAFNGQGSGSVLRIWQLWQFLLCCNLPGFTVIVKFEKDLRCYLHLKCFHCVSSAFIVLLQLIYFQRFPPNSEVSESSLNRGDSIGIVLPERQFPCSLSLNPLVLEW